MRFGVSVLLLLACASARADFSLEERKQQFAPAYEKRLKPLLRKAGLRRDPVRAVLVFFKDRRRLDLYAGRRGAMKFVRSYPVLAASGTPGPKLREGDLQVPEGIYKVEALNPNSRFHVSLRLNYPNAFDVAQARSEGRTARLGGDIMIHGNSVSIGCLALGDEAIEEIFALAQRTELDQWKVILAPYDFRHPRLGDRAVAARQPRWVQRLYGEIESELRALP